HHGGNQCRADRAEKTEREKQAGYRLRRPGESYEQAAGTEAELFEEPASPRESVAAEPTEQFLGAMGADAEAKDEARNEQSRTEHLSTAPSACLGGEILRLAEGIARVQDYPCPRSRRLLPRVHQRRICRSTSSGRSSKRFTCARSSSGRSPSGRRGGCAFPSGNT